MTTHPLPAAVETPPLTSPVTTTMDLRKIERMALMLLGVALAGSVLLRSWPISLGVAVGGVLGLVNFRVLAAILQKGFQGVGVGAEAVAPNEDVSPESDAMRSDVTAPRAHPARKAFLTIAFIVKNVAVVALMWILVTRGYVHALAFGVGFSTLVLAVVLGGLMQSLQGLQQP